MTLLLHHSVVAGKSSTPQALPPSLLTNLVAWWKLDETSGDRVNSINPGVYDLTAPLNPASETGKNGNAYIPSRSDNPALFTNNCVLRTPHAPVFAATQDISIQGWINLKSGRVNQVGRLLVCSDNAGNPNYWFQISTNTTGDGSLQLVTSTDSVSGNTISGAMPFDVFHQIVITLEFATRTIKGYVNGVLVANGITGNAPTDTQAGRFLSISQFINAIPENCSYEDIGFWSGRILTQSEVTALYNSGAGVRPS